VKIEVAGFSKGGVRIVGRSDLELPDVASLKGLELAGKSRAEIYRTVDLWLAKLHLADFRDRFSKDLSGGMRQRVAIARALALDEQ
jgi:ABC-type methionine transport system ATPase subunit